MYFVKLYTLVTDYKGGRKGGTIYLNKIDCAIFPT